MLAGPLPPLGPPLAAAAWTLGIPVDPACAVTLVARHGRRMARFVAALEALGYLDVTASRWRGPTFDACRGAEWGDLPDALRGDRPLANGGDGEASTHEAYLRALDGWAERPAAALADRLATSSFGAALPDGPVLDLGGGLATYGRRLAARFGRRCVLLDRAATIGMVKDLDYAVEGHAVDLVAPTPWPVAPAAIALVCNVLHLYDAPTCAALIARAAASLAPGGVLVIRELVIDADGRAPLRAVLFALNMAVTTRGGDVYTEAALTSLVRDNGELGDVAVWSVDDEPESRWFVSRKR